jgi:hypothetical protein
MTQKLSLGPLEAPTCSQTAAFDSNLLEALSCPQPQPLLPAVKQPILGKSGNMDGPDSLLSPKFAPFIGMVRNLPLSLLASNKL